MPDQLPGLARYFRDFVIASKAMFQHVDYALFSVTLDRHRGSPWASRRVSVKRWQAGRAAILPATLGHVGRISLPRPAARARCNASIAAAPFASRHVPCAGESPDSGPRNLSFGATNSTRSARGAYFCHHGADVRSGTSATPLPCAKNLSSQIALSPRPPNGGFNLHPRKRSRNPVAGKVLELVHCVAVKHGAAPLIQYAGIRRRG